VILSEFFPVFSSVPRYGTFGNTFWRFAVSRTQASICAAQGGVFFHASYFRTFGRVRAFWRMLYGGDTGCKNFCFFVFFYFLSLQKAGNLWLTLTKRLSRLCKEAVSINCSKKQSKLTIVERIVNFSKAS
jgi:hypothetical protein